MPITNPEYNINDLPNQTDLNKLVGGIIEMADKDGNNSQVDFPTVVQAVGNNLPGANSLKSLVKSVKCYDTTDPQYYFGNSTLVGLDPSTLAIGSICWVQFPVFTLYVLLNDEQGNVGPVSYDGTFDSQKYLAKWVEFNSIEALTSQIKEFNPFKASYAQDDNVKYTLGGKLRFFAAKKDLVLVDGRIPYPQGQDSDPNWQEFNAVGATQIKDWLPGSYKKDDVVFYKGMFYRAKRDVIPGDPDEDPADYLDSPKPAFWLAVGGSGGGIITIDRVTVKVGGYDVGDRVSGTVQEVLTKLLSPFEAPGFASFGFDDGGSRSVLAGTRFSGGLHSFYWSTSNVANVVPNTVTITDATLNTTLIANTENDGGQSLSVPTFTLEPGQRKQFHITAQNSQGGALSADVVLTGVLARFYGASALTPSAMVAQLQNGQPLNVASLGFASDLGTGLALNHDYDCAPSKFIYYLYDANLPNPSLVRAGLLDLTDYTMYLITITDQLGTPRSYKLFSVNGAKTGNVNVNIIA